VLVALVALGVLAGLGVHRASNLSKQADERAHIVSLAGEYAVDYSSLDYRHLQADVQAEIKNATGQFATRYRATVQLLTPVFVQRKLVATGSVTLAGIASMTKTSAVVLVALNQVVKSTASTLGTTKLVRMEVSLSRVGGRWLASNVVQV
jgi:Mce-associated membrane protein